ncbi:protein DETOXIFICATION 45, chloroplastic isoform X2 [Euphorbia lathyris]|uniref:protein DETOXIFICATION 45, chloroplastic isoform X2 n=1 Tax=Euphorbia lathyris TaxID=212925 RepID=UPI003313BCB4
MTTKQFCGSTFHRGFPSRSREQNGVKNGAKLFSSGFSSEIPKGLGFRDVPSSCCLSAEYRISVSPLVIHRRKRTVGLAYNQSSSGYDVESTNLQGGTSLDEEEAINGSRDEALEKAKVPIHEQHSSEKPGNLTSSLDSTKVPIHQADIKRELIMLSLPAMAGQAIDPLAQLMETAYIGRLGPVELGSAGISITIFNTISKLFNMPLLSVATSFVAEDISKSAIKDSTSEKNIVENCTNGKPVDVVPERKQLPSVSTALFLAVGIGIFEAVALSLGSGPFLNLMGVALDSPMRIPAERFLKLRALGAPAVVASLALQGVFRGFKDTTTPVYSLALGNFSAIFLFPILMYYFKLGVTGAAISTVISQYITAFLMMWHLNERVILLPPKMGALQFGVYMKSGGFLIGRTLAVLTTTTLATSMAARQGAVPMAAHQICMQVWLAVSLLTDALAASGQALIASYSSKGDYKTVKEVTSFVLKIGLLTGVVLAAILGVSFGSIATLFTKDAQVLGIVQTGILFVSASQPLNALAFIFDGLHYGVSDFPYAAYSMMAVGVICSAFLLYAPSVAGLHGVWSGLALFMALRTAAGFVRLLSKSGPWWFMHKDLHNLQLGS